MKRSLSHNLATLLLLATLLVLSAARVQAQGTDDIPKLKDLKGLWTSTDVVVTDGVGNVITQTEYLSKYMDEVQKFRVKVQQEPVSLEFLNKTDCIIRENSKKDDGEYSIVGKKLMVSEKGHKKQQTLTYSKKHNALMYKLEENEDENILIVVLFTKAK